METINAELQEAAVNDEMMDDEMSGAEEGQKSNLEAYMKKYGVSWNTEENDGCISAEAHVDSVLEEHWDCKLGDIITDIGDLRDQGLGQYHLVNVVMARFGHNEGYADISSDDIFGQPLDDLIVEIHDWIKSDYAEGKKFDWYDSKEGMHEHLVWIAMDNLAFLEMDEDNSNP